MASEVCSIVTGMSEVPILLQSQITCKPDEDVKSAYKVECAEIVTSCCDDTHSEQRRVVVCSSVLSEELTEQFQTLEVTELTTIYIEPEEEDNGSLGSSSACEEDDQVHEMVSESLVVPENEVTLESGCKRSRSPIDTICNFRDDIVDAFDNVTHTVEYITKKIIKRPHSIQELPENNLHLIHPNTKQTIGFGLHIEEHKDGFHAARVIENGLASKSKLQCGDVIRKINGFELGGRKLDFIAKLFTEMDITKTITLVVHRVKQEENGDIVICDIEISITLTLSDDNITFEVEVEVTATKLKYQSTTDLKYVQQNPHNLSPKYLKIDGNQISMSTGNLDRKYHFKMELYQGGSGGRRVCVMRNESSAHIIVQKTNSSNQLKATAAPVPNNNLIHNPDTKFFYWYAHPTFVGDVVFESVTRRNYFMNVTNDNSLVLKNFSSASQVGQSGRFRVIDV